MGPQVLKCGSWKQPLWVPGSDSLTLSSSGSAGTGAGWLEGGLPEPHTLSDATFLSPLNQPHDLRLHDPRCLLSEPLLPASLAAAFQCLSSQSGSVIVLKALENV